MIFKSKLKQLFKRHYPENEKQDTDWEEIFVIKISYKELYQPIQEKQLNFRNGQKIWTLHQRK